MLKYKKNLPYYPFNFSMTKLSQKEVASKSKRKTCQSESSSDEEPQAKKIKLPKPIQIKKEKTVTEVDELSWLKDVLK